MSSIFVDIDSILDDVELQTGSISNSTHVEPFNTGLITLDLMCFAGISGGIFATTFGKEQSGKSTLANEIMAYRVAELYKQQIKFGDDAIFFKPANIVYDYEGSFDFSPNGLFMNTLRKYLPDIEYEEIFGVRDNKGGWVVPPLLRFHKLSEMEVFFNTLHGLGKKLPDVTYFNGRNFVVYDPKDDKGYEVYKKFADKDMLKKTKKYWCELPTGMTVPYQALLVADSYPAMLPKSADDDEANKQMALLAREFAKHIPRVRGSFRAKRITTFGVNQFRERPGFSMGSNEYEPCGSALRFASDLRIRSSALSPQSAGEKPMAAGSSLVAEPSVLYDNVDDQYSYIKLVTAKNKLGGMDKISVTLRLWRSSGKDVGLGFDPVFDTFTTLKMSGMLAANSTRNRMKFVDCYGLEHATKPMSWESFKVMCLVPMVSKEHVEDVLDSVGLNQLEAFDIRAKLRADLLNGKLVQKFRNHLTGFKDSDSEFVTTEETEVTATDEGETYAELEKMDAEG